MARVQIFLAQEEVAAREKGREPDWAEHKAAIAAAVRRKSPTTGREKP